MFFGTTPINTGIVLPSKKDEWCVARRHLERILRSGACHRPGSLVAGGQEGKRVSLLSDNRLEWLYADMGSLGIGVCVIPVYPTLVSEEIEYIINNSESKVIVPENKNQLKKILEILDNCPSIEKIIVMEEKDAMGHPKL